MSRFESHPPLNVELDMRLNAVWLCRRRPSAQRTISPEKLVDGSWGGELKNIRARLLMLSMGVTGSYVCGLATCWLFVFSCGFYDRVTTNGFEHGNGGLFQVALALGCCWGLFMSACLTLICTSWILVAATNDI
jgi:hypothetical protein